MSLMSVPPLPDVEFEITQRQWNRAVSKIREGILEEQCPNWAKLIEGFCEVSNLTSNDAFLKAWWSSLDNVIASDLIPTVVTLLNKYSEIDPFILGGALGLLVLASFHQMAYVLHCGMLTTIEKFLLHEHGSVYVPVFRGMSGIYKYKFSSRFIGREYEVSSALGAYLGYPDDRQLSNKILAGTLLRSMLNGESCLHNLVTGRILGENPGADLELRTECLWTLFYETVKGDPLLFSRRLDKILPDQLPSIVLHLNDAEVLCAAAMPALRLLWGIIKAGMIKAAIDAGCLDALIKMLHLKQKAVFHIAFDCVLKIRLPIYDHEGKLDLNTPLLEKLAQVYFPMSHQLDNNSLGGYARLFYKFFRDAEEAEITQVCVRVPFVALLTDVTQSQKQDIQVSMWSISRMLQVIPMKDLLQNITFHSKYNFVATRDNILELVIDGLQFGIHLADGLDDDVVRAKWMMLILAMGADESTLSLDAAMPLYTRCRHTFPVGYVLLRHIRMVSLLLRASTLPRLRRLGTVHLSRDTCLLLHKALMYS